MSHPRGFHATGLGGTVALGIALCGVPCAAAAPTEQPLAAAIDVGDSACLAGLAAELERYLERPSVDARFRVTVREEGDSVSFQVAWEGRSSEPRRFGGLASCEQRLTAAAASISTAIDYFPAAQAARAPIAPPAVEASRPPPLAAPLPEVSTPAARSALGVTAVLAGAGFFDVLPAPAAGLMPSLDLRLADAFDVRAAFLATSTASISIGSGSAEASLLAGVAQGCFARPGVIRLRACAGFAAGRFAARGLGFAPSYSAGSPWLAVALRIDARFPLGDHVAIVAGLDGLVPVLSPDLQTIRPDGTAAAFLAKPRAGMALSFGPAITFR